MEERSASRFIDMPSLDYGQIKDEVTSLPKATFNLLEREWPAHWPQEQGPKDLIRGLVRTSEITFRSILHLVSDEPDPHRLPEFVIAVPPLTRTLVDTLVTTLLLFDDFRENSRWYFRGGWRELKEARERYTTLYPNDPVWTDWLEEMGPGLEQMRKDFGISGREAEHARRDLPYWPTPSQVPSAKGISADRAEFAQYLLDAHYRNLSQDAHLSWPGFLRRAAPVLRPDAGDLGRRKHGPFLEALVFLLAILTEINSEGRLGLESRLAYLWGILSRYHVLAESLHEKRYSGLISSN